VAGSIITSLIADRTCGILAISILLAFPQDKFMIAIHACNLALLLNDTFLVALDLLPVSVVVRLASITLWGEIMVEELLVGEAVTCELGLGNVDVSSILVAVGKSAAEDWELDEAEDMDREIGRICKSLRDKVVANGTAPVEAACSKVLGGVVLEVVLRFRGGVVSGVEDEKGME
jgi:hypothetical protein